MTEKKIEPIKINWSEPYASLPSVEKNMTEEEKVWRRLKHGAPTKTFEDEMVQILAESVAKQINEDLIREIAKTMAVPENINEKHK